MSFYIQYFNPLSANPAKWSNTLKQFVDNLTTNRLSLFDHFMNLALKGLRPIMLDFHLFWKSKFKVVLIGMK